MAPADLGEPCDGHGLWGSGTEDVTMKSNHEHSELILMMMMIVSMMIMSMIGPKVFGIDE